MTKQEQERQLRAVVPPTLHAAAVIEILGDIRQAYEIGLPYGEALTEIQFVVAFGVLEAEWPGLTPLVMEYLADLDAAAAPGSYSLKHPAFRDYADLRGFVEEAWVTLLEVPRGEEPASPIFGAMWRRWREWHLTDPETFLQTGAGTGPEDRQ